MRSRLQASNASSERDGSEVVAVLRTGPLGLGL